jgi:hypothetical protein
LDLSSGKGFLREIFLTGQRCQTLYLLNIDNMQLLKDKCIFYVNNAVKQTSARKHVKPLELL